MGNARRSAQSKIIIYVFVILIYLSKSNKMGHGLKGKLNDLDLLEVCCPGPRSREATLQGRDVGELDRNKLGLIYYCIQGGKRMLLPGGTRTQWETFGTVPTGQVGKPLQRKFH